MEGGCLTGISRVISEKKRCQHRPRSANALNSRGLCEAEMTFPTHVVVSCARKAHFQNPEALDFEPKAAPGTPHGPTGAPKTPKGSQRDNEYITNVLINPPNGRYVSFISGWWTKLSNTMIRFPFGCVFRKCVWKKNSQEL